MIGRAVIGLVAATLMASSASASEWWLVVTDGRSPNQQIVLIDSETMTRDGDVVTLWNYSINQTVKAGQAQSIKGHALYDCAKRMTMLRSIAGYTKSGDLIAQGPADGQWNDIAPDSVSETILRFACGDRSKGLKVSPMDPQMFATKFFAIPSK